MEKWKSKKWFDVNAPKILGEGVIGEIPAMDEKNVIGRIIKVSLSWITKNPTHYSMTVGLRVTNANGNTVQTDLDFLEEVYSYTHSLVRRGSSVIYTIDRLNDKDGKSFVLKLIVVTRSKITTPKKRGIRKELSSFVREYAAATTREDFIKAIIDGNFQGEGAKRVNNIASVGKFDVKKVEF